MQDARHCAIEICLLHALLRKMVLLESLLKSKKSGRANSEYGSGEGLGRARFCFCFLILFQDIDSRILREIEC